MTTAGRFPIRPPSAVFRLLWLLVAAAALGACRRGKIDRSESAENLESAGSEAVMRHVLEHCPIREMFDSVTIVLGEAMEPATAEFEQKFADTGLEVIPYKHLVAGVAAGKVRIFEPESQKVPVVLQVSEWKPSDTDPAESLVVAAWAWKDESARARYRVTRKPDGTFDIKMVEEIPIVPRNQDFKSDVEKEKEAGDG